ncbi:cytochrome c4 [Aquisalimonas sp. 2447]|uniref:c-type cytochrome n=1 Tax=Aquisalimonas sp. 2447 TaxID=2740807 RepID=UPI0014326B07|nr:c-type cytochrome [Aquisalimonas sp. 2447]QIT57027.1 cytochrome c4 [Aquisalimonas sp. 2447]
MNNWIKVILAGSALVAAPLLQAGDISRGEELSGSCAACHGADGNSDNPEWPNIAGQGQRYLFEQLKAYQTGDRENAVMAGQVSDLDEQDMRDLAAYYASLEPGVAGGVDPDLRERGEDIYRGGIPDKGVAACMACHGPAGAGMAGAGFPRVGGQHAQYTAEQLRKYRDGDRDTDRNRMMRDVAERLSDDEIEAVSSYLSGLHRRQSD